MKNLIDKYVLFARVAPIVVVTFPLFLAISAWIPFSEWPIKLLGGSTLLIIAAFVLAQVARDAGSALQGPLWDSWGGPPTVRMLRHRDATIEPGLKALIHRRLVELHIVEHMPSVEEEMGDPQQADKVYLTCSVWLRNTALEQKSVSPFDVVHSENISYGFRRNILGIRRYGVFLAVSAGIIAASAVYFGRHPFIEIIGIALVGTFLVHSVTPAFVKRAADEYSIRLLNTVQSLPNSKKSPTTNRSPRKSK